MTQDAPQPRQATGLSVAGWPLRRKIALALAVPLLLAATLGGLRVQNDLAEANSAATSAKQVTVLAPAVEYLAAAETAMVAAQGTSTTSEGVLLDALDEITRTSKELRGAVDGADLNGLQAAHVSSLLDLSQAMRSEDAADLGGATWIAQVRQLESSVSQLISSVNAAQATPEPRLEQLSQALNGRLSLTMQQAIISTEDIAQSDSQELFSELGVEASAIDRLAGSLGAEFADEVAKLRTTNTEHAGLIRDDVAMDLGGRQSYIPYDTITTDLLAGVESDLNAAAGAERRSALVGALVTLAALAAAVALAFLVARSLLVPIGRVRDGALSVARQKLPDAVARIRAGGEPQPIAPIDVHTNEEVGQVARAVDDLHRQAIHLAAGEAQLRQTVNAMFVTLSRRSNSLVNQQLAQIERLEQDEEDPKRLESLFRLDHLASRMRRTADSLLILADAPNKAAGQLTLTVGEALQAATSGVQDYQRVQIMSHLGTRISEDATADVVHLLTELVDNALTFSPPTEPVRLNAVLGTDGVTLTVVDAGLGVPASELEQFNEDLASNVAATPETARRMGLFVVARLAERHGITARLAKNPGGGLTATVVLPPAILPELPQQARPARTAVPAGAVRSTTTSSSTSEVLEGGSSTTRQAEPAAQRRSRSKSRSDKAAEKAAARAEKAAAKERAAAAKAAQKAAADKAAADKKAASDKAAAEKKAAADKAAADKKAAEQAAAEKAAAEKAAAQAAAEQRAAAAVAAEKPADVPAAEEAAAVPAATAPDLRPGAGDPDRPPLGSLLPRREPGANLPRTGADAFLPPETSATSGPLFGKRSAPAAPAAAEPASRAEKFAPVVPITALAARQRAQAEEDARTQELLGTAEDEQAQDEAEETPAAETTADAPVEETPVGETPAAENTVAETTVEETPVEETVVAEAVVEETPVEDAPVEEPVAQQTVRTPDPLTDPLPVEDGDEPVAPLAAEPAPEPALEPTPEPVVETAPEPTQQPTPEPSYGAVAAAPLVNGLPTRRPGGSAEINGDMPGLPSTPREPAANGNDSPIFKSIRSGFLAGDGQRDWHETEIDRGWEIAEHVAEEVPVVESTSVGLPRRQPGERLVPGSVTPPTGAKVRDPEAIRRRLQSHTAGVSRGRRAATNSSTHKEAGQA